MDPRMEFQSVVQELQLVGQQMVAISNQQREVEGTIAILSNQPGGKAVFRQAGSLLLEVDDRAALLEELEQAGEAAAEALLRLAEKESELRARYESISQQIEGEG